MLSSPDFESTWLWRHSFVTAQKGISKQEQQYFRDNYLSMRNKVSILVSRIAADMPELTVHDITHLDALWETASIVAEGKLTFSPAEAFVFGAAVLLHDAAMSLAAYPHGLDDIKKTVTWEDCIARLKDDSEDDVPADLPPDKIKIVVSEVLRSLHAEHSEELAEQAWVTPDGEQMYLIDDAELRFFYSRTIGEIAHSHWWPVSQIEIRFSEDLGAFPQKTKSKIDKVKLACLLRIADAIHLDQRRAPRFLRSLLQPTGLSATHWSFQEKLATPLIEHDSLVFTVGAPFALAEADGWWLAYDTLSAVDRELHDVDLLLQNRGRGVLRARRVKGVEAPEQLAQTLFTRGWRPVDTQLRVSDIPKIVETLGGSRLYGNEPTVPLRELIQNSADAIQARCHLESRDHSWGVITISLAEKHGENWLTVEDNGVGMSEAVLTGPLIDFGCSFWKSSLATEEFPGLLARGMRSIGHFGIGFFSVFMLGSLIRVTSRRYDRGKDTTRILEFREGTTARPILYSTKQGPLDGGTRIEILLKEDPEAEKGLLGKLSLAQLIGSLAPSVGATIKAEEAGHCTTVVEAGDWISLEESQLLKRIYPDSNASDIAAAKSQLMRCVKDGSGRIYGRAFICPSRWRYDWSGGGWVTVGGLRASKLTNIHGILVGQCLTAARDSALPSVPPDVLSAWASEQATLIASSKFTSEIKARCAEVVLECGGNIYDLPIACWGDSNWLDEAGLRLLLSELDEIMLNDTDIDFDEDKDNVHPREFRDLFIVADDLLQVPYHNGNALEINRQKWPRPKTGDNAPRSRLIGLVTSIIKECFGPDCEVGLGDAVVGDVNGTEIVRPVDMFWRSQPLVKETT